MSPVIKSKASPPASRPVPRPLGYSTRNFIRQLSWKSSFVLAGGLSLLLTTNVFAQPSTAVDTQPLEAGLTAGSFDAIATIWLLTASALIFFMNAGFAMLETGFCRTGNAVNVLAKNLIVFCIATLAFWCFGFRFMMGDSASPLIGQIGLPISFPFPTETILNPFPAGFETLKSTWEGRSFAALFFFQLVFAGTTATIVSGAVAERVRFWAFILFSFILVAFIYPLIGYWSWGGGWLSSLPIQFRDFAGSAVVHSVGGAAALVGALLTRPRQGKFGYDATKNIFIGKEDPARFEEHNLSLATLGCLILWLGWFGFNGGSTTRLEYIPHILTTTFFSAAAGGIGAVIFSPFITDRKARLSAIINGILGGLVGITAASAYVSIGIAIVIGASSGLLVVVATKALNRWRIDDPVGAVPVHLVCGGWGTIAVGLFASPSSNEYQLENYSRLTQIFYQTLGWTTIVAVVSVLSLIAWLAVGCMLYALSPKTEIIRQARKERVRRNFSPSPWTIGLVPFVLHISRQGLRVPLSLEEKGGTPTLLP